MWVGLVVCAAFGLFISPGVATAKPGYITLPGYHEVALNLKSSNGYSIKISTGHSNWVEMFASRGESTAIYLIRHARMRSDGIEAEFPGVGRVSVRFHPTGRAQRESGFFPPCRGGQTVKQPGYFEGTIRIRGERGYTTVDTKRATGEVTTAAKEVCKRSIFSPSKPEPKEDRINLLAYSRSQGRTIGFSGTTLDSPLLSVTFFAGSVTEQREGMVIFRQTTTQGKAGDLVPSDVGAHPLSATASPPGPFHGSAVFQRNPGGDNAWAGSLSVELPGAGRVNLAGPDFSATLCQDSGCPAANGATAVGGAAGRLARSLSRISTDERQSPLDIL
jgi:hypothetical protein